MSALLQHGELFKHVDGGIYKFNRYVRYSDRPEMVGIEYDHVWPFEQIAWVRPMAEWTNFEPITAQEATAAMRKDKVLAQVEISNHKNERKAAKAG